MVHADYVQQAILNPLRDNILTHNNSGRFQPRQRQLSQPHNQSQRYSNRDFQNEVITFKQFLRRYGIQLLGCSMSWLLLDIAFYSQVNIHSFLLLNNNIIEIFLNFYLS